MDIWVVSALGLLWITFMYQFLHEHVLSILLGRYLGVEFLDHMLTLCLTILRNCQNFPKLLYHFTTSPGMYEGLTWWLFRSPDPSLYLTINVSDTHLSMLFLIPFISHLDCDNHLIGLVRVVGLHYASSPLSQGRALCKTQNWLNHSFLSISHIFLFHFQNSLLIMKYRNLWGQLEIIFLHWNIFFAFHSVIQ